MEIKSFEEMGISQDLLDAITDMGFSEPTPIQALTIPAIRSGRDVIGQSQTGSGKTAAFGIPCIEKINIRDQKVQALILSPTRELALQICEELRRLLKYRHGIKVLPIYGGQPIDRQILALKKGVQIIVGTPGRVIDHLQRKTIRLKGLNTVVLDEADEMLDMGFREDIELILKEAPEDRQTIFFSATMPQEILNLTTEFQTDPLNLRIERKQLTAPSIEQAYYEVSEKYKTDALCRIIDNESPRLTLVFVKTKKRVDLLAAKLQSRGFFAEGLHGDLRQIQRDRVMGKFREGRLEILVATDVAARGIDVEEIDLVVNYDIPQDDEYYVHRIGRTGRAGRSGRACTFVAEGEMYKLREIMKYAKIDVEKARIPLLREVEGDKIAQYLSGVKEAVEEGNLDKYADILSRFLENESFTARDVAAAILKKQFNTAPVETDFVLKLESEFKRGRESSYSNDKRGKSSGSVKKESGFRKTIPKITGLRDAKKSQLSINLGKNDGIWPAALVNAIAEGTGLEKKVVGDVDVYSDHTIFEVPKKHAKDIVSAMKGKNIKGVKVKLEIMP